MASHSSWSGGSEYPQYYYNEVSLAVSSDTISVPHTLQFCKPVPMNNFNCAAGGLPLTTDCGVYTRDLKDFPLDDLPSGGPCTDNIRISPGEMVYGYIKLNNYNNPNFGTVVHTWFNKETNQTLFTTPYSVPAPNPSWTEWWWYSWSICGHFSWEINSPGSYQLLLQTTWGDAKIDFTVVDTSCQIPNCGFTMT